MIDARINPDKLLQKIKENEFKEEYGKLKIFLGAAAGVGKTYAMLKAASSLLKDGEDIVIGYIETHNRIDTEELLPPNIEYIPLKLVEYKGVVLKELDVDAILKRKPHIVIVDELAHSNAFGSRNNKRYQDVLELLNAGIDVYTALNIQHIESLNDIVEQIVGTKVMETVPDQMIEMADEVVLIDLPSEELIERLNEGKIYPKGQIQASLNNFFRKGNLTALRELALRKTAQKVDRQVLEYRQDQFIDEVWASGDKLLLVLESGYSTEKIVRSSKNVYDKGFSQWFVGYFEDAEFESKSIRETQKMLDLLDLAKQLGAVPIPLVGVDPAMAIATVVEEQNISTIVLAQYKLPLYYKLFGKPLAEKLRDLVPNVSLHLITDEATPNEQRYTAKQKTELNYVKLARKLAFFFSVFTLFGFIMYSLRFVISGENAMILYLFAIVFSNYGRGKFSAFMAAIMATISFDFFVTPPYFSFVPSDSQNLISLMLMTALGVAFSIVTGNLRYQVSKLQKWQQQIEWLNKVNEEFAAAMVNEQVLEAIPHCFTKVFHARYMLLFPNDNEDLELKSGEQLSGFDPVIAKWVFTNNKRAGLNTDTFALSSLMYIPVSKIKPLCVFIIKPALPDKFFLPDMQNLFDNFIKRLAISLERIHFMTVARHTMALDKERITDGHSEG